jgi:hypothetical protein
MIDTAETLHAVEMRGSVVRRKACLCLDDWSLRRWRLRVRRVGFGTKRTKTADKDEAGNQRNEQSSGYLEHLSHPNDTINPMRATNNLHLAPAERDSTDRGEGPAYAAVVTPIVAICAGADPMIDTVETLHAVETHGSVVRRKACRWLGRRHSRWRGGGGRRRQRLRMQRRQGGADQADAGNEGDEQSNGYLGHLSHPNGVRSFWRRWRGVSWRRANQSFADNERRCFGS